MRKNKLFVFMAILVAISISVGFFWSAEDNGNPLFSSTYKGAPSIDPHMTPGMTTGASMPTYAYHGGDFALTRNDSGWVYVVGGDLTGGGVLTQQNLRYNVRSDSWSTMALYPTAPGIWYTSGATLGQNGYICGGLTGGALANTSAQLTKYDVNANTWTVMAPMPAPRAMNGLNGYQDSILYAIGGFDATGTAQNNVYVYNANSNTWRTGTALPVALMGMGFSRSGDTLVVVNGTTGAFAGTVQNVTYRGVISQSDRSVITWTTGLPYPGTGRFREHAYNWGCKGIVISGGGTTSGYTPVTGEVYSYSPGANVWTVQPSLITTRCAHMSGSVKVANGVWKFVNVCGFNGANVLTTDILTDTLCPAPPAPPANTTCRNGINVSVPDNTPAGTYDTIRIPSIAGCTITDVNMKLDTFLHTWDSDMSFNLVHGAQNCLVINAVGGSGDNFFGTILNDSASAPISGAVAPCTGSFSPSSPLAVFNGTPTTGNWVLWMVDHAAGDVGFLHAWCLTVSYTCPTGGIQTVTIPNTYRLGQNYPNPFNPTTVISYGMPKSGNVSLKVYDILGREVKTLVNEFKNAGMYEVSFDASSLSSGIYFYTLKSGDFSSTKKMLLVK